MLPQNMLHAVLFNGQVGRHFMLILFVLICHDKTLNALHVSMLVCFTSNPNHTWCNIYTDLHATNNLLMFWFSQYRSDDEDKTLLCLKCFMCRNQQ